MSEVRDKIADVIIYAAHEQYEPYAPPTREEVAGHTDTVIRIVRDALLSGDAIDAAIESLNSRPSLAGYGAIAAALRAVGLAEGESHDQEI